MKPKGKPFRFKQFDIYQDQTAMKVGTDGVLLGAWINVEENIETILDIGSGTGLISLMLAQRSKAQITAIEIEAAAAKQAEYNFNISNWANRLTLKHQAIQSFASTTPFDIIACNPPYYSYAKESSSRSIARSQQTLELKELITIASSLLSKQGSFNLIIPFLSEQEIIEWAGEHSLLPKRIARIKGNKKSAIKRSMIEFSLNLVSCKKEEIIIELDKRHQYSNAYRELLKDYLLIF